MKISSLLDPKLIKCGLSARTKEEALDEIVRVMADATPGLSPQELRGALADREKLGPFSMAKGSAFPHARTEKVSDFRIAVGTAPGGIDFKVPDGNPIRLIVLFAIPKKHSNLYLHTLAQLLNLFGVEENFQRVAQAGTPADLVAAVETAAVRQPVAPGAQTVPSITARTSLSKAIEVLSASRLEAIPVVDAEGNLVGELTSASLLQLGTRERAPGAAPGGPPESFLRAHAASPVEGLGVIATNGYRTVQEDEPLVETAVKLSCSGVRGAYVLRGQKLVGTLTAGEVLRRLSGGA